MRVRITATISVSVKRIPIKVANSDFMREACVLSGVWGPSEIVFTESVFIFSCIFGVISAVGCNDPDNDDAYSDDDKDVKFNPTVDGINPGRNVHGNHASFKFWDGFSKSGSFALLEDMGEMMHSMCVQMKSI